MPALLTIRTHSFAPGDSGSLTVNLATLASRTPIDIPLYIFRAPIDGPVLLLMAGMHGDEVNGTEIIRRMISRGLLRPVIGSVIALPLLNIYGFINFARYVPDGKDVNRSFPGSETGSLASRMAHFVTNEILPLIDFGVDFHTGGGMIFNYPQVRCVFDREQNLAMGKAFAPPLLINAPLRDKSLRQQAEKTGKTILVYEAGESMRFDEHAIQEGIGGTLRLMNHLEMVKESPPAIEPTKLIVADTWVRALHAGFFHPTVAPGDEVVQGQLLGYLTDPDGTDHDPVHSQHPGIIISVNNMPVVNVGDALLHLGKA
jgi:hypothetical protein